MILVTVPVLLALSWLVRSTRQGKAMRATAQDPDAAAMVGINVNRTISFTFALAGGLAGVGGLLFLLQFNIRYDTGFELGLIAFTAAVLGGIGNLTGAVLGAVTIGLIQAFNEGLSWVAPGSDWTRSIVFGVLIVILVFRPAGPARRADAGPSMTEHRDRRPEGQREHRRGHRPERRPTDVAVAPGGDPARRIPLLIVLVGALLYPFIYEDLPVSGELGDFFPALGSVVISSSSR